MLEKTASSASSMPLSLAGSRNCVSRMEEDGTSWIHASSIVAVSSPIRILELAMTEAGWAETDCGAADDEDDKWELINQAMAIPPARMIPYVKSFCSDTDGSGCQSGLFIGMI